MTLRVAILDDYQAVALQLPTGPRWEAMSR